MLPWWDKTTRDDGERRESSLKVSFRECVRKRVLQDFLAEASCEVAEGQEGHIFFAFVFVARNSNGNRDPVLRKVGYNPFCCEKWDYLCCCSPSIFLLHLP